MRQFTPVAALSGGLLVGCSAVLLFWVLGRIAGISGILFGALEYAREGGTWRLWFLAGLLLGPLLMRADHVIFAILHLLFERPDKARVAPGL